MIMNMIFWNCHGVASKTFSGSVRDLLHGKNHILILLETRVSGVKAYRIMRRLGFDKWI